MTTVENKDTMTVNDDLQGHEMTSAELSRMAGIRHSDQVVVFVNRCQSFESIGISRMALFIADSFNPQRGYAWQTYETIAAALGVSPKTIGRWAKQLAETGLWTVRQGGNGMANQYSLSPSEFARIKECIDAAARGDKYGTGTVVVTGNPRAGNINNLKLGVHPAKFKVTPIPDRVDIPAKSDSTRLDIPAKSANNRLDIPAKSANNRLDIPAKSANNRLDIPAKSAPIIIESEDDVLDPFEPVEVAQARIKAPVRPATPTIDTTPRFRVDAAPAFREQPKKAVWEADTADGLAAAEPAVTAPPAWFCNRGGVDYYKVKDAILMEGFSYVQVHPDADGNPVEHYLEASKIPFLNTIMKELLDTKAIPEQAGVIIMASLVVDCAKAGVTFVPADFKAEIFAKVAQHFPKS